MGKSQKTKQLTTKEYHRRHNLRRCYGISHEEYEKLLAHQGGVCAICKTSEKKGKEFSVDHDHSTGVIRGITCQRCNTLLGAFPTVELLRKADEYLAEWEEKANG